MRSGNMLITIIIISSVFIVTRRDSVPRRHALCVWNATPAVSNDGSRGLVCVHVLVSMIVNVMFDCCHFFGFFFFFCINWKGTSANAGPHYQKLYARVTHIWGNPRCQPSRSAMRGPHPERTSYMIKVPLASGKYALAGASVSLIGRCADRASGVGGMLDTEVIWISLRKERPNE